MNIYNDLVNYLNKYCDVFILKDESALKYGYRLDREVSILSLDSIIGSNRTISEIVINFCNINNLEYKIIKNTNSKLIINIEDIVTIETRFIKEINYNNVITINNTKLYNINRIASSINTKFSVFKKISDMYNLVFIIKYYWDDLTDYTKDGIKDAFTFNGIKYYLDIINNNTCEYIDNNKLKDNFISIYNKLELTLDDDNLYEG